MENSTGYNVKFAHSTRQFSCINVKCKQSVYEEVHALELSVVFG